MTEIIPFSEDTKSYIKTLNTEWLNKYFSIEPSDELQLNNPQSEIIDKGGKIFYASYNNKIVGTVTLMKVNENTFELSKMAVTEALQGKGIGRALMEYCLKIAKENHIQKLILYSNTKLETAIAMYYKYGFREITFDATHYKRANIKMELSI